MAAVADIDTSSTGAATPWRGGCCPAGSVSADAAGLFGADDLSVHARDLPDGTRSLEAVVETLDCPSCVPGIERSLIAIDGVEAARINATQRRLHLVWRPEMVSLDTISAELTALGHRIAAFDPAKLGDRSGGGGIDSEGRALLMAMAVSGFAFANVMLMSVAVWAGLVQDMGEGTRAFFHWLSALIALPSVAYAGRPFFRSAMGALRAGGMNMDVPIALAVTLAAGMSLVETTLNGPHVYYDAALGLLFFLLIGRYLDRSLRRRAFAAAENLLALRGVTATVVCADGSVERRSSDKVVPGDTVRVAAGEAIAVDGIVRAGQGEIDEQLVTGETLPRRIGVGDAVHAGTINLGAPIEVETRASGESTLVSEIAVMMDRAGQRKALYVRFADRVARIYAPVVHLLALLAFVGWFGVIGMDWRPSLLIAVAVLIVTCPCALGLAVPAVQVGAVGRLLKRGVYVKSGDALERLADVDMMVFDKTGTLTLGRPVLVGFDGAADDMVLERAVLERAVSLARHSRHPLAVACVEGLEARASSLGLPLDTVTEHPGDGMEAMVEGVRMRLGRRDWVMEGRVAPELPSWIGSELWVRIGDAAPLRLRFRDRLRPDAVEVVRGLKARGVSVALLSGDRAEVAEDVARELGIETWTGGRRPDGKIADIEAMIAAGHKVAMVGDGLNDAPALAAASVSLSPATAADVSQVTADLVFRGERLGPVVEALDVARRSNRLVRQNVGLALGYNLIAVPLAMLGMVTPLIAAIVMSASSIVVTANALRIQRGR
jgi:Cu2+-exporting ATPase